MFYKMTLCYNSEATAPKLVQEGGRYYEHDLFIFAFCSGKCSRLLHLQMAGQKIAAGSQPED